MPLRLDGLLIRREDGHLPESSYRELSVLLALLNRGDLDSIQRSDRYAEKR